MTKRKFEKRLNERRVDVKLIRQTTALARFCYRNTVKDIDFDKAKILERVR